jgi:phenylpropionate dioxygenase-like ring-hydroxylating dioxygenase large terminal subunit
MIEETHWHPVAACESVQGEPVAVVLLERPVVLWRDAAGVVHAWADRCPHRGARLSLGRVVSGSLECPYHGWQFGASGQCVRVPALPSFEPPAAHCAVVHQACERYGLVWVKLDAGVERGEPAAGLPAFAAEWDERLRKINCGPYDVATSAGRIVENFLDMAHFGFVHEGWLGARNTTAIDDYQIATTPTGLRATGCKAWQPQSSVHSRAPAQVEYTYDVVAPFAAVLTKTPEASSLAASVVAAAGYQESIALFITPMGPEQSRVWFRMAVTDFATPDDKLRDFQHTIFMQDKPILESQNPRRLPLDLRAELHTVADKASSAYRRHLQALGVTFGVC